MAPSVAEFYANKSVVVTGSTGFLGKTLVEKLLRDCPQLHKIYVLVRPAKDKTPAQRVEEVVQGVLFDRLRRKDADFAHKIHPVLADLAKPGMGIAEEDLVEMRKNASIILHCAATVNFNEKLDLSLATNVSSVKNLIAFARTLERLEAFVHVSTAYAHCDRSHIEEKFYEPTVKPQALIDAVNSMSPEAMAGVTKPLLGKRPNTYTFTKSLAEAVLLAEGGDLPTAVVRPSIVGGVFREPFPGWTDNLNGPGGFYLAAAHGLLRVMAGTPTGIVDIVPVDHCVNMIVAVGWKLGTNRPAAPMVFNCTSGATNPIKLKAHNDYVLDAIEASPIKAGLLGSRPFVPLASEWQYYNLWNPVMHTAPAMAIDLYRRVVGKKPIMNRIYQKLNNSIRAYAFFTTYEWHWDVNNSAALIKEMSEQDRKLFPLDLTDLNWELYIKNYYEGCKRFLKEDQPAKSNMASAPSSDSLTPASLTSSPSAVNMSARVTLAQKSVPCAFLTSTLVALLAAMFMVFFYDLIFNSSTSSTHAANPENRTADDEHYATTFSYASAPFPFNLLGHILASE